MHNLLYLFMGSGLLLAALSIPLVLRKVKPNPIYGFRVQQTLENPETWYAVNQYFAKYQIAAALAEVIAAISLYFWPNITIDGYALSVLGIFVAAFAFAFFQGWKYLKSLP